VPFTAEQIPLLGPDIAELLSVFVTIVISVVIMVLLGRWWAQ